MFERAKSAVRTPKPQTGEPLPHESAKLHVTGEALYTDDIATPADTLHAYVGLSQATHARIKNLNLDAVRKAPGVVCVVTASEIPGSSDIGPVYAGDPLIAGDTVEFRGQILFAVAAVSQKAARRAARLAEVEYEMLPPILDSQTAHELGSYVRPMHCQRRGDAETAIAAAPLQLEGEFHSGGQEQMYLEGQVSLAIPDEDEKMLVYSSTQHPSEGQKLVAEVLNIPLSHVTVQVRRMGGAFGGKETNANQWACLAALLAHKTSRPVRLKLSRAEDFMLTGKRHPFLSKYRVGFAPSGEILGLEIDLLGDCGMSADLSDAIVDRAMFHIDNCYFLDSVTVRGYRVKTHKVSNTAFRGFGGPQGILAIENIIEEIASATGLDPLVVRQKNFYGRSGNRDTTHYGQRIEQHIIQPLVARLVIQSEYQKRKDEIHQFNQGSAVLKRGIAITPVKFGISFTVTHLNQAGALLHIYTDGSVQLNHGGTEMGQGLYTKVAQIVATTLQIDVANISCTATRTDKVPNTSPTAASSGSDLNGMAAKQAAEALKNRLSEFAARQFAVDISAVQFAEGNVHIGDDILTFAELARLAYLNRVSLSAVGYYRTLKFTMTGSSHRGGPSITLPMAQRYLKLSSIPSLENIKSRGSTSATM